MPSSQLVWAYLHLSESQRVMGAFPIKPPHAVHMRASEPVVTTVQIGVTTALVPPAAVVQLCA